MAPNQGKILIKAFFVKCDLKSLINSALLSPQKLWSCPCSSSAPSSPLIEGVCFPQEHCATIAVLPFRSHHRPVHCTDLTFIWVIWPLHSLKTETADAFLLQDFAECLPLCSGWKIPEFLWVSVVLPQHSWKGKEQCFMTRIILRVSVLPLGRKLSVFLRCAGRRAPPLGKHHVFQTTQRQCGLEKRNKFQGLINMRLQKTPKASKSWPAYLLSLNQWPVMGLSAILSVSPRFFTITFISSWIWNASS